MLNISNKGEYLMAKKRKNKRKLKKQNTNIQNLKESRVGGQVALAGYSFQFLYSCYLILSEAHEDSVYHLEGIEDIDYIKFIDGSDQEDNKNVTHIQIKYSSNKQDASFFKKILENFLEVYLIDKERRFKLVYDFEVSSGNFSKLISNKLDAKSVKYWREKIREIRQENPLWSWNDFDFDDFICKLSLEYIEKDVLANKIEKLLISNYKILTDNISLYANGIKFLCLQKMEIGGSIKKEDISRKISSIQEDIEKGANNPAFSLIKRIDFNKHDNKNIDLSYYEGKKPTFTDIANKLPVRRPLLEKQIIDSINENRVTIIKASSGQGKTTLAYQVAYDLQKEYTIYQVLWCNDVKELRNIVSYFETRVKMGEKPLIILDNLDEQLSQWNKLAQLFQEQISYHYKLVITTREDDWYYYRGDLSNLKALKVVNLFLTKEEAQGIYSILKKNNKVHESIKDWRKVYRIIEDRKLLIEYVYLLTHGEMLSERIDHQVAQLSVESNGKIKCDLLRKVCFADACGIKLSVTKLLESIADDTSHDVGELLKSLEKEYLIRIDSEDKFIEGLHPVRSQHLVDRLHQYTSLENTALKIAYIVDPIYQPKFYSYLPRFVSEKENFYTKLVKVLWKENDLSAYVSALQGVFSGSVMEYFKANKSYYDDANEHGGLYVFDMELNPFINFEEIDETITTLDNLKEVVPDNKNIIYLIGLRDRTPKIKINETDIFLLANFIFQYFQDKKVFSFTTDIDSYAKITYWLIKIDSAFNLSKNVHLKELWENCNCFKLDTISTIMYSSWLGNKEYYLSYVNNNIEDILTYLRNKTESLEISVDKNNNSIHVDYILLASEIKKGNEESVERLKVICKTLPIFDTYNANGIKPSINYLSQYNIPDDSRKRMPRRNIIIMFNQEFTSLWSNTILSNYEGDSVEEWLEHWFEVRQDIITLINYYIDVINKLLSQSNLGTLLNRIVNLYNESNNKRISEFRYPFQERPFEEKANLPDGWSKIKIDYFQSFYNFSNQFVGFLNKTSEDVKLALINLRQAKSSLVGMQDYFYVICKEQEILIEEHLELCNREEKELDNLIKACIYYKENKPNRYFNKYQINRWYEEKHNSEIINSKKILVDLTSKFDVIFPERYFYEGILSLYPIIVKNLNITNEIELLNFLYLAVHFHETNYDYLIVITSNEKDKLNPNGLKFSKKFFEKLHEYLESDNDEVFDTLNPPFPLEVTSQMLACFDSEYYFQDIEKNMLEGYDLIGELLWAKSMARKRLNENEDKGYLDIIAEEYDSRINHLLEEIKKNLSSEEYKELVSLCNRVNDGEDFLDNEFNDFLDELITRSLSE